MIRPCGPCGSCGCTHSLDFLTEPRGRAEESDSVSVSVSFDGSNGPMAQWLNLVGVMSASDVAGRLPWADPTIPQAYSSLIQAPPHNYYFGL
jgi:hypothetical protein